MSATPVDDSNAFPEREAPDAFAVVVTRETSRPQRLDAVIRGETLRPYHVGL